MSLHFSEAIKLKDGVLYHLGYHQRRVDRTLQRFYGTRIYLACLQEMIPGYAKEGLYKCRVVYGSGLESVDFIPYRFRRVKTVGVITDNTIEYSYKYTDRSCLNALLKKSGCDDVVIVKDGLVTDSLAANLVFSSESGLFTPESCLLRGTKRQYLLDEKVICKKTIYAEELSRYERLFFISAMIDLEDRQGVEIASLLYL